MTANSDLTLEQFLVSTDCRNWLDRCANRLGARSFESVFNIGKGLADSGGTSKEPVDAVRGAFDDLAGAITAARARMANVDEQAAKATMTRIELNNRFAHCSLQLLADADLLALVQIAEALVSGCRVPGRVELGDGALEQDAQHELRDALEHLAERLLQA